MPNSSKYFQYTLDELKKSSDRKLFNVVSFFAGGGGSSCGYKLAGGDILCVNEFQQIHADTYNANFPDTPVAYTPSSQHRGCLGARGTIREALSLHWPTPGEAQAGAMCIHRGGRRVRPE